MISILLATSLITQQNLSRFWGGDLHDFIQSVGLGLRMPVISLDGFIGGVGPMDVVRSPGPQGNLLTRPDYSALFTIEQRSNNNLILRPKFYPVSILSGVDVAQRVLPQGSKALSSQPEPRSEIKVAPSLDTFISGKLSLSQFANAQPDKSKFSFSQAFRDLPFYSSGWTAQRSVILEAFEKLYCGKLINREGDTYLAIEPISFRERLAKTIEFRASSVNGPSARDGIKLKVLSSIPDADLINAFENEDFVKNSSIRLEKQTVLSVFSEYKTLISRLSEAKQKLLPKLDTSRSPEVYVGYKLAIGFIAYSVEGKRIAF